MADYVPRVRALSEVVVPWEILVGALALSILWKFVFDFLSFASVTEVYIGE